MSILENIQGFLSGSTNNTQEVSAVSDNGKVNPMKSVNGKVPQPKGEVKVNNPRPFVLRAIQVSDGKRDIVHSKEFATIDLLWPALGRAEAWYQKSPRSRDLTLFGPNLKTRARQRVDLFQALASRGYVRDSVPEEAPAIEGGATVEEVKTPSSYIVQGTHDMAAEFFETGAEYLAALELYRGVYGEPYRHGPVFSQ